MCVGPLGRAHCSSSSSYSSFFLSSTLIIGSSTDGLPLVSGIYCHRYYVNSELISVFAHRIIVRRGLRDHVVHPLDKMN